MHDHEHFLRMAVQLAHDNIDAGGRPFGAVVVKGNAVVATGVNEILATRDPTSHAELNALRGASQALASPDLTGCVVYASGHPCPMCLAAMRMSGITEVYFAYSNEDAAPFGLSTAAVYAELAKPLAEQSMTFRHVPIRMESGEDLYAAWSLRQGMSRNQRR
ncbi:MAG: nucleoside deaminase [Lysobacter sp.]|nr:nucleoside deaminase [Lysobacter sp.]